MNLRRRAAAYLAASVLAAGIVTLITPDAASAHGAMMKPGSRTYLCWVDGLSSTGEIKPQNEACKAATNVSGVNALYTWYSVLRSDGAGRMEGFIPDGQLCSGGNANFSGFDLPSANYPRTHLSAGANFAWWYSNWAAHPGTFSLYVTKDGWNQNAPLAWDDLEATPFLEVTNPPQDGPVGSNEGHYYWDGNLPAGKSGNHIIYSVWTRSDSTETFYNCSDVVFDGGNGAVTGLGNGGTTTPTSNPTTPAANPTTPAANPTTPAANPTTPGTSPSPTATGMPANGCMAIYSVESAWSGGQQGKVELMNHNSTAFSSWTATLQLPAGYTISSLWGGTLSVSGSTATVKSLNYNGTLAPEASTTFGFLATGSGLPSVTCSGA